MALAWLLKGGIQWLLLGCLRVANNGSCTAAKGQQTMPFAWLQKGGCKGAYIGSCTAAKGRTMALAWLLKGGKQWLLLLKGGC
jgi:hypothetical protein